MSKAAFTIDDSPMSAAIPDVVRRIALALDGLPAGKLLTTRSLAGLLGCGENNIRSHSTNPALAPYREGDIKGVRILWGNGKTVALFRVHKARRASIVAS